MKQYRNYKQKVPQHSFTYNLFLFILIKCILTKGILVWFPEENAGWFEDLLEGSEDISEKTFGEE